MGHSQYSSNSTNTLALVSLISGILSWFVLPLLGAVVAIVTGHMARSQIESSYGREEGAGLALIGLILGYLHLVGWCVGLLFFLLFFGSIVGLGGCAFLSEVVGATVTNLIIPFLN